MLYPVLFGMIIFLGLLAFYNYYYDDEVVIKRAIAETRPVLISAVEDGDYARIEGKAEAVGTLFRSPLSGRPCISYRIVVEEKKYGGYKSRNSWKTIFDEEKSGAFILRDASGAAYVNIAGPDRVHWEKDRDYQSSLFKNAGQKLEKFLAERHQQSRDSFGVNRNLRCKEGILEPGEVVAVLGYGSWRQEELPEDIRTAEKMLRIEKGKERVYITDATT